jgi:hypothetical protein
MYRSYSEKAPSALCCVPQEKKGKKKKKSIQGKNEIKDLMLICYSKWVAGNDNT